MHACGHTSHGNNICSCMSSESKPAMWPFTLHCAIPACGPKYKGDQLKDTSGMLLTHTNHIYIVRICIRNLKNIYI